MLDPVIHQATRLRIMAVLQRNRDVTFVAIRDELGVTDGNLNAHGTALQEAGYITIRRVLGPGGFAVRYRLTPRGAAAFEGYARDLIALLETATSSAAQRTSTPQLPSTPPGKT